MNILKKAFVALGITASTTASTAEEPQKPKYRLPFKVVSIDDGSQELHTSLPISAVIINKMQSPDGGEYYLASLKEPLLSDKREVSYIIVGARFMDTGISPAMKDLPINIALVTNNDLAEEEVMDFDKAEFAAIGTATAANNL